VPFVASFAGTAGTKLTALTPSFVLLNGTDDLEVDGAGGVRRTVTGTAHTFYSTYNDGVANQSILCSISQTSTAVMVLGSVAAGQVTGYFTRPQTGNTSMRLWKVVNNVVTQLAAGATSLTNCQNMTFSVVVTGGVPTLTIRRPDNSIYLTFTDSAAPIISGRRGIYVQLTSAILAANAISAYSDDSSNGPLVSLTIDEIPDASVFEAIAGPPAIAFTGTKGSTVGAIERQVELSDATVVLPWATTGMSAPTTNTWAFANNSLPIRTDGRDYRLRLREAANVSNTILQAGQWAVGLTIPYQDQSLHEIMSINGKAPANGAITSVRANQCRVMTINNALVANSGVTVVRLNTPNAYGSGITQMADEIGRWVASGDLPNVPIMFVNIAVSGQTMTDWNNDVAWGNWSLLQIMNYMLARSGGRISALMRSIVVWPGTPASAITAMNQIVANVTARLPNQPGGYTFPVWVMGGPRATRAASSVLNLRAVCETVGSQGGRYSRLSGPVLDLQMEGANQLHQATGEAGITNVSATAHIQGSRRYGFRHGRGLVARLQAMLGVAVTADPFGPTVVARQFTSPAKTSIRITYDRDTKLLDGSTTDIPQFYYSTDNKITWVEALARKTGARTFEMDHPTGNWVGQTVHFGYCKDSPWGAGNDTTVTPLLAKLVYDNTDFGNGTEMVAMADEGPIADEGSQAAVVRRAVFLGGRVGL
jgi:hypothetical protein